MLLPATIAFILLAAVASLWWHPAYAWDATPSLDFKRFAYVRISAGRLRGFETNVGVPPRSALVFKRIPYAAPPVGRLRFHKAQHPNRWNGDWDATKYGPACLSNTSMTTSPQANISEDCLHINIFTSPGCVNGHSKCPVLVYIHGGGLYYDSAVMFSDRQIVEKYASDDVVFVIPAFRLGVFGSFDIGDSDVVPPNLGLEDIIYALEWTRREISAFGGDSSRLTVMGNSGGGFITQLLMVHRRVPQSLFQRAIVSSGASASANWGAARPLSNAVLDWFNCSTHSIGGKRAQIACLRSVSATALLEAQRVLVEERGVLFAPVTPTADLPVNDFGRLLRQTKPRTLWAAVTSEEYSPERQNTTSSTCREAASWFGYKSPEVQRACLQHFYPNQGPNEHPTGDVREVPLTSAMHARTLLFAMVNAHKSSSSYYSTFALANHSQHSDDLLFFFGLHWTRRAYTPAEVLMDRYYPQVVKNFVRYGRPESFWRPIESDGKGYFIFDFAVDANLMASIDEAVAGRALRRLRLTRWPRFIADAYDDPAGDRFWLLDQARTEVASLGWTYRRRASGHRNQSNDNENDNDKKWNENQGTGRYQGRHDFSPIPILIHQKNVIETQREYERQQQKRFDTHRRPYKDESNESAEDYQSVYHYDNKEDKKKNKWLKDHIRKSHDNNKSVKEGRKEEDRSHSADKFWEAVKTRAIGKAKDDRLKSKSPFDNVPFVFRMNITRNGLNCKYETRRTVGQLQAQAHFKCVRSNDTESHNNGYSNKYGRSNKNYSIELDDDRNDTNNYNYNSDNDSYRNRSNDVKRWQTLWNRNIPCLDCRPNHYWWRRIGHGPGLVRLPHGNVTNWSTNDKNATKVSLNVNGTRWSVHGLANMSLDDNTNTVTVIDSEPPFWLPFVAFYFNSAFDFPPTEKGDRVAGDAEVTDMATTVEIEDDGTVDLIYYDALEQLRSAEDTLRAALAGHIGADTLPPYSHTVVVTFNDLPLGWLALSIIALSVAVVLIVVAARLLFHYRNQHQRGYNYHSRAGDYLDETSRILSNPRGSASKYNN